jgi:hypothetical protein
MNFGDFFFKKISRNFPLGTKRSCSGRSEDGGGTADATAGGAATSGTDAHGGVVGGRLHCNVILMAV